MVGHVECVSLSTVLCLIPGILCLHNSITGVIHKFSVKTGNSRNEARQLSDEVMNILPTNILNKGLFQSKKNKAYTPSCNNRKLNFFALITHNEQYADITQIIQYIHVHVLV